MNDFKDIDPETVRSRLEKHRDRLIEVHPSLPSTNTRLMRLASENARDYPYASVVAVTQTAGRGRFSRRFYSPAGAGLYMSVLLPCPSYDPDSLPLTVTAGAAAAEAAEAVSGVPVRIKWVNDLTDGVRKLGGILCESSADGSGMRYVVAGFGINITAAGFPPEIADTAVSLEQLGGYADPAILAGELLRRLDIYLEKTRDEILAAYRARMTLTGQRIRFYGSSEGEGIVLGTDSAARLLVRTEKGVKALDSGEITLNPVI